MHSKSAQGMQTTSLRILFTLCLDVAVCTSLRKCSVAGDGLLMRKILSESAPIHIQKDLASFGGQ